MIVILELNLNTLRPLAMLLLSGSTICDAMSGFIPVLSPSPAHGESREHLYRLYHLLPFQRYVYSGKGFARGDALMRHRQRGICVGSIVPIKSLKRKASDEASTESSS
jgi:hypothetical protein